MQSQSKYSVSYLGPHEVKSFVPPWISRSRKMYLYKNCKAKKSVQLAMFTLYFPFALNFWIKHIKLGVI